MHSKKKKLLTIIIAIVLSMNILFTSSIALEALPTAATVNVYHRVNLDEVGGVAGLRGGINYYENNLPIGGNMTDGGQFNIPWFSSNVQHKQEATVSGDNFQANALYVLLNGGWWGNHLDGQQVLRITVTGSTTVEHYLVSGENFSEWNTGAPATMSGNTKKVSNNDIYTSSTFLTKLDLPIMDVSDIKIELINQTAADDSRLDNQPVIELFGMTLARENVDTYNLNSQFNAVNTNPGPIAKFKKLNVGDPSDVAGQRGAQVYFKDKVPLGGNITDGQSTYIPWFSSNPAHTQKRTLYGDNYKANTMYILCNFGWWGNGDQLAGKPILKLRINDDPTKEMFIISGINSWEWNTDVPNTIAANTEKISIPDTTSSSYVTKFTFPDIEINKVDVELLSQTAAYLSRVDNQQIVELMGVTLGQESNQYTTTSPSPTSATATPTPTPTATATPKTTPNFVNANVSAIDLGVKLWWTPFNIPNLGYRLYRSTIAGEEGISVTDFPIESIDFIDANVKADTTYFYTVRALLREANPFADIKEELSDPVYLGAIKTKAVILGGGDTSGVKNFILMKLNNPKMTINGTEMEVDPGRGTTPIIYNSRTLLPIRSAIEAMGGTVEWVNAEKKVVINYHGINLVMWVDKKEILVNGVKREIDVAPSIINARTMVPVRFVAENLGCQIEWIASTKEIVIVYQN